MSLLEVLRRKLDRMGVAALLIRRAAYLALLISIIGVAWLLWLPLDGQYRRTYFSENALMPSQAYSYFRETEWNFVRGYRKELEKLQQVSEEERAQTISSWLSNIGYKSAIHNWDLSTLSENLNGTTPYGILHAPRGDDTEAMVLVAPWTNAEGEINLGGTALVLALARFFQRWSVWAKNIIVVFPRDPYICLRLWAEAYHTSLDLTGGSIEAALILDYAGTREYFDSVELSYEGLNGQLPNLDLVNVMVSVSNHEGLPVAIQQTASQGADYSERLWILLRGMYNSVVAGLRRGPGCESFSGWRIQAVTIRAVGSSGPADITTFGRIVEAACRCVNNLLEHFHQSFFFYFLLGPKIFVSIGSYLPAGVLIAASFALKAIALWLQADFIQGTDVLSGVAGVVSVCGLASGVWAAFMAVGSAWYATVWLTLLVSCIVGCLAVPRIAGPRRKSQICYFHIVALMYFSIALTGAAMLHFALAVVVGLLALPMSLVHMDNGLKLNRVLLAVSSPFFWSFVVASYWPGGLSGFLQGAVWGWIGMKVWTFPFVVLVWLATWLCCLLVVSLPVAEPDGKMVSEQVVDAGKEALERKKEMYEDEK